MIAQPGEGVHLRPDLDGAVGQRVLKGDRDVRGEEPHEVELPRLEARLRAETLEMQDAEHALTTPERGDDQGRRIGASTPHAARFAGGENLGDDAATVGQAPAHEDVRADASRQHRTQPAMAGIVDVHP